jgi:putative endonuclease
MSIEKQFFVYMLASKVGGTLYIGVTSDLVKRCFEHRSKTIAGFSKKYEVKRLVYFERFSDARNAISREKRLKKWNRNWKIKLTEENNPNWIDLYPEISGP